MGRGHAGLQKYVWRDNVGPAMCTVVGVLYGGNPVSYKLSLTLIHAIVYMLIHKKQNKSEVTTAVSSHSPGHTPHPTAVAAVSSAAVTPVTTAGTHACLDTDLNKMMFSPIGMGHGC